MGGVGGPAKLWPDTLGDAEQQGQPETKLSACEEEDRPQHRHPRPGDVTPPPRDAGSNVPWHPHGEGRHLSLPQVQGRGRLGRRPLVAKAVQLKGKWKLEG